MEIKQKNACRTQTQGKSVTTMENVNAENANVIVIMLENFVLVIKMSVQSKSNVMPSDITNTGKKTLDLQIIGPQTSTLQPFFTTLHYCGPYHRKFFTS